eukprot:scaffold101_cov373-Prasinococcus_capsulatus_cf.AAC.9
MSRPDVTRFPTFVFSVVRDPAERCLSAFYFFMVHTYHVANTPANKLRFLRLNCTNYQYHYLRTHDTELARNKGTPYDAINHLLSQYSFIGMCVAVGSSVTLTVTPSDCKIPAPQHGVWCCDTSLNC